jgi:hypothetical protein
VRPGSRTKVSVPLVPTQNRHPERSALTDLSRDTALVARSRRTSAVRILPMLFRAFQPPNPIGRTATVFPWGLNKKKMITVHEKMYP